MEGPSLKADGEYSEDLQEECVPCVSRKSEDEEGGSAAKKDS
jgi:hypothetical protein